MMIRLNKALASLGICSRRDADKLIANGDVFVNDELVSELGFKVSETDRLTVLGRDYTLNSCRCKSVWIYYKPVGLVTTHKDEKNRRTVFDDVAPNIGERVISVGRLDLNSEGLLLLTNDSEFARKAESPQTGWERHYKVRIFGDLTDEIIAEVKHGVVIDRIRYGPMIINRLTKGNGKNQWIECILTEGKNREIRRILNHFGIAVNKLIRIKYGPFELGDLKPGELRRV